MIITSADQLLVGHTLSSLPPAQFLVLSSQAQSLASSPSALGINPELQQITKIVELSGSIAYLGHKNIRNDREIAVRIRPTMPYRSAHRGAYRSAYGLIAYGPGTGPNAIKWEVLATNQYALNFTTGRLEIMNVGINGISIHPFTIPVHYSLAVSMWAGWDFTPGSNDAELPEVLAIKSALIGLMEALRNDSGNISEFQVDRHYEIKFREDGVSKIEMALLVLKGLRSLVA